MKIKTNGLQGRGARLLSPLHPAVVTENGDMVLRNLCLCISSCTIDRSCEAYEYNVTDEGTCHLLNGTSSATRTIFSDKEISLFIKGRRIRAFIYCL